jgi:hypothetical protein
MASDSRHLQLDRIVGPFAELLLANDLPQLSLPRRAEVVKFVQRRADLVPSFTRFGVTMIALFYRALIAAPGGRAVARVLMRRSLPVLGEYPRLVRSLGFAYIWEHGPDTSPTGAQP